MPLANLPYHALTGPLVRGVGEGGVSSLPANAMAALSSAQSRRVDVLMVGDSNNTMTGYGWWGGFQKALASRFGTYASQINALGSSGVSALPVSRVNGVGGTLVTTGAPTAQTTLFSGYTQSKYGYIADGSTLSASGNGATTIMNVAGGLDIAAALTSHLVWASFATGAGSFKIGARLGYSPFTTIANGALVNTNTGEVSLHRTTLSIPADAARTGAFIEATLARSGTLTGPFFGLVHRVENPAKLSGVSVSTLDSTSGWSLYDIAADLIATPDATLVVTLGEARYLQASKGQTPRIVVAVNAGMNDRNETSTPSLGPNPSADPDSPEAYIDNLNAIVNRIEAIYTAQGWPLTELYWLIFPSHPQSDPDDAELITYRAAAKTWAQGKARASCFDFTDYINSTTIAANGWYDAGGNAHLTIAGYDGMTALLVNAIP